MEMEPTPPMMAKKLWNTKGEKAIKEDEREDDQGRQSTRRSRKTIDKTIKEDRWWIASTMTRFKISMYAKCGEVDDARKLFDEMPEKDVVT
ncbi:hypothetical protein RHGRI_038705 [Rhododendron griersonianum]|uniref:Pentatricopeptide repeat-containing protein n=1 Tax=Rhododendron griersonianum TaxID=479676 RepID=A0AAV6HIF7_9ERIC|nr:hypothetical protein RHGRI_038705 [Rhododendron griersonianum]